MIESMSPHSGRMLKEDDSVVNIADLLEGQVYAQNTVADLLEGQVYAQNTAIATGTAEFEGSDSANALKEVEMELPEKTAARIRLEIVNPSIETDLTVEIYNAIGEKDYFVDWFTIPKKTTRANGLTVEAHTRLLPPLAGNVKIAVSNDTALTTAFDATVTIREV